ncbi:MAG: PocR ligand-binding domain-containing protein [Desulfuromonadales bacterium]|nr:PocR ligand-binding domain-containing protein [Desulfuromonadales bacterium]
MNFVLSELVNVDELQSLCELFSQLTGFATAILDMEAKVLIATNWQEICLEFHRNNPETAEACRESDTILGELLTPGTKYNLYMCRNGLVDVSVPIMLDTLQIGRLYTGQFLFAPPDVPFFRRQAARYGFDETSYLEAVQKVQIVTEEQVGQVMAFLSRLAEMIGRMGLANQRLREANAELWENRQELERRVDQRTTELSVKNEQLHWEIDERKRAEEKISLSLAEKEILLKEIHHRVKNNLQIISTLLDLHSDHIDERSWDIFREIQSRIRSIALVHEKLYQTKDFNAFDFNGYLESLADHLLRTYLDDPEKISLEIDAQGVKLGIDDAVPCGLIICELLTNSLKYAFPEGRRGTIVIHFQTGEDQTIILTFSDDGVGLPNGLNFRNTETLGLQLVNMLVRQLRGQIAVEQRNGTSFVISFKGKQLD